jgi:NAD(P)-dependent dehydrogenase (short-subunit alcohol dehydrogenase family)
METQPDPIERYAGSLTGRVGFVTGAGTGIGRAVAIALARAGADVAVTGRRPGPLLDTVAMVEARGRRALALPGDVTDPEAVSDAATRTVAELGPVSIAVANAGVDAWGDLDQLTSEMLRKALATNAEGVANVARALVPAMRERGDGKLIVVASDNGRRAEAGGGAYVASKFAAVGLALSLSQELYGSGVSVHVIEPGCVDTEWYPSEEDAPRERMLRADDVALTALFLATLPPSVILEEILLLPRGMLVEPW